MEVVNALLDNNADPTVTNKEGMTALQVAVEYAKSSTAGRHEAVIAKLETHRK